MQAAAEFPDFLGPIQGHLAVLRAAARRRPISYRSATAPEHANKYIEPAGTRIDALRAKGWRLYHLPTSARPGEMAGANWYDGSWAVLAPGEEPAAPMRFTMIYEAVVWAETMDRALFSGVNPATSA